MTEFFLKKVCPVFLFIVCILYLHYFNFLMLLLKVRLRKNFSSKAVTKHGRLRKYSHGPPVGVCLKCKLVKNTTAGVFFTCSA